MSKQPLGLVGICVCVCYGVCCAVKSLAMSPVKTLSKHTQKLICRGRSTTERQDKQGVKTGKDVTQYNCLVCVRESFVFVWILCVLALFRLIYSKQMS